MAGTFYWHDYETWGADPARDRPAQFAGLRTDWDLNPLGEPLVLYCRPTADLLPQPEACLVTGLIPQTAAERGLPEPEFIARIHAELARPATCGVGYNSIRFDDEVTRYTLYRNFFDPYGREWRHRSSRWDLIDVLRLAHALRPEGLEWPQEEEGRPSFRLEALSAANGIAHEAAHDALSDVRATIGLARLLRRCQPRLFAFALGLRDKARAQELLALEAPRPLLHVSSKYPAEQGCIAPVQALATHPSRRNEVLVVDLRADPALWQDLAVEEIRRRVFTSVKDLPSGVERLPLKTVHINRSPMLAPMTTLTAEAAERWAIDSAQVQRHAERLHAAAGLAEKLQQIFREPEWGLQDPEQALYAGFLGDADLALCEGVRAATPAELARRAPPFRDPRLATLLLRYRARHWPETLSTAEREDWEAYRRRRLTDPEGGGSITLSDYRARIAALRVERAQDAVALAILDRLEEWAGRIAPG
jgi:exodeoxyribonuclease I